MLSTCFKQCTCSIKEAHHDPLLEMDHGMVYLVRYGLLVKAGHE